MREQDVTLQYLSERIDSGEHKWYDSHTGKMGAAELCGEKAEAEI